MNDQTTPESPARLAGPILINGAGGFLGSHVVETFIEQGYACRVTDRPGVDLDWAARLGATVVPADLLDFDAACRVTDGVAGVVNVAGVFDFSQPWDVLFAGNVSVTRNMCRAALEAGVQRFVHIASVAVYGTPAYTPIAEDGPKRPKNHYERTKLLGEEVVFRYQREAGLPATSLRPAPIYGPRSRYIHSLFFATACLLARNAKATPFAFADGVVSHHVHVRDVARATALLMARPRAIGNAYNCADATPIRWHRLLATIGHLVGSVPERVYPWPRALMSLALPVFDRISRIWPQRLLERHSQAMAEAWSEVVAEEGLEPALRPHLARDMFQYMAKDHAYDTLALRDLGFSWEYPHIVDGLADTHRWLVEQRWIPAAHA